MKRRITEPRRVAGAFAAAVGLALVSCETPGGSVATPPAAQPSEAGPEKPAEVTVADAPVPKTAPAVADSEPKAKGTVTQMDLGQLFNLQGDDRAFLIDVRPAYWYNAGHLPGAISIPRKKFDQEFPAKKAQIDAALAAGKVLVLYCTDSDCPDGRFTAKKLAKEGYSSSVYKGGWKEWKASGLGG